MVLNRNAKRQKKPDRLLEQQMIAIQLNIPILD
jgi:hypothetical protein